MQVGCLGTIAFSVSDSQIKTMNNVVWGGSSEYTVHRRHGTNSLTEFVGRNPDTINFDITLSAYFGVNPKTDIETLWGYVRNGTPVGLVIGEKGYGKYRWNVTSMQIKMEHFDSVGNLTQAVVSVELQEYLRS